MNEVKGSLRSIEQKYKLFQQQQFTFIAALEHCRENAHDKIRPISSIEQVQSYTEHHCSNATDRRILYMFLDLCAELSKLCQRFETLHVGTPVTNSLLDKCKTLVSQSNDLSSLRARYPHDVVNHLSCDEARNHYGGVVSLIPLILDLMKEWIAHSEKLPRKVQQHVSEPWKHQEAAAATAAATATAATASMATAAAATATAAAATATDAQPSQTRGARPWPRKHQCRQLPKDSLRPRGKDKGSKPPWRPPGGKL